MANIGDELRATASVYGGAQVREPTGGRQSLDEATKTDLNNDHFASTGEWRLQYLPLNVKGGVTGDSYLFPGAFYSTDQETVDYYWMVLFVPSMVIFLASAAYLVAGIAVAYSAPDRHGCLKVIENDYCASKRCGIRYLFILNAVFAIIFGVLALFFGSSLLTLGSSCSLPFFWCYEIAVWGLEIPYWGTAIFLRRRAAVILDGEFSSRTLGLEMSETNPLEVTSDAASVIQYQDTSITDLSRGRSYYLAVSRKMDSVLEYGSSSSRFPVPPIAQKQKSFNCRDDVMSG
ncbi:D-aminoacid aminotransferase-like PLP-dependent enzymes superfamily protein isoform 1 [Hibiscus syriacus]|uniref:D-aminoacid aminotransferase-like PLP-dependent enzymes superfamily protein isoform 1 n=1 Tax=Hibiscus syriacus TaxID=106335 RepID=A0A6A2YT64_HIBSY|nr:D-aminoacid aminotransferase-like PLP-dependent enzymes superfamily protein isoform 1 [Hibiscus syriacus]